MENADAVSDWATEAVQWAVAEGILKGVDNTDLAPQGLAHPRAGGRVHATLREDRAAVESSAGAPLLTRRPRSHMQFPEKPGRNEIAAQLFLCSRRRGYAVRRVM